MGPDLFVVLLAGVVHAMLQLGIGTLLILYHASLGKHISLKTRGLVTNYIFGNALLTGLAVSAAGFIIYIIWLTNKKSKKNYQLNYFKRELPFLKQK
jgi:hypothetical protein